MASAQLPGAILRIYVKRANGDAIKVFEGQNEITGPGGSPDGAIATVKDNELPYMPLAGTVARGGDKIVVTGEMTAADGADASDSKFIIPVKVLGKGQRNLSTASVGYTVDIPAATAADVELPLGAGYTVPNGEQIQVGGAKFFMSWEDDAA